MKNPCRDSRPARHPPAGTTGKAPRKSPAKNSSGSGRESPGAYASSRTGTNGRNYTGRRRRLAEWPRRGVLCARYQVYTRSISDPPIVPPSPMQEPNAIPAKSTASTTSTADSPHNTATPATPAPPAQRAKPHSTAPSAPANSPHHSATASDGTHNSQPAPHQAGQIGTTTAATGPTATTGPARRAVGTPGGDSKVCGFGSAKVF